MPWFGLQEEEEIGVLLQFSIVGIMPFGGINLFQRSFDFALLSKESSIWAQN